MENQLMTETYPKTGSFHSSLPLNGENRITEQATPTKPKPKEMVLLRVDKKELGLVKQTEMFVFKDKFLSKKDGGIFIDLPDILFDESYFEQIIVDSPAGQFGEYDSIGGKTEIQMNLFAQNEGFYFGFDLTQIHSLLVGGWNKVYDTLNIQSIPYLFPLESKKGMMMFRAMRYVDGF